MLYARTLNTANCYRHDGIDALDHDYKFAPSSLCWLRTSTVELGFLVPLGSGVTNADYGSPPVASRIARSGGDAHVGDGTEEHAFVGAAGRFQAKEPHRADVIREALLIGGRPVPISDRAKLADF
jgi:hypothetical protein